ncbi:Malto-oligosyltrehalose trehalohydrolase [Corynebacterium glaucum]|uniref:Malto-oligosyltrehalose trehalohydrolase n=1 Tax=Corynebacterium glaucum TaxID=187491 RepID=A0A1Q2HXL7_9CORY|nr:malto-oligosyltrehalose trehalohydrolase [Corynebacterium glaucum]AQQ15606.1 Malto-oligosyltrehalose trehalohydrolase [Corynebacterium glaucum]
MQRFQVWAPHARDVRITIDGATHDMRAEDRGWWFCDEVPQAGQRYTFSLFDGTEWTKPLPDPRTRSQPDGVHGPSEVVADDFEWTDHDWAGIHLRDQVIYELHVGTFTPEGTFNAVTDKLEYLAELGVNAIELMPVQPFAGTRNWGYDGVDWFAVQHSYGGPEGLKRLVDAAHAEGIAVILDVVYNHFGPEGNYNPLFGPYTTHGRTGWGDVVNISGPGSDEVRAYILDSVRQWLSEFHVDGLRLDAVHAYDDRRAYSLMEEIRRVADEVADETQVPRTIIGETDQNDPRIVNDESRGGYGLSAQWLDDVHHCVHTLITGERQGYYIDYGTVELLADTLRNAYRFRDTWSEFRARTHGRPLDLSQVAPWRMVTFTTNHDQTGNRAAGDRPSQSLSPEQLALRAATILLSPFTPMLFMGEEFGARTPFPFFVSHTDDELARMTREGRLQEFARQGWNYADVPDPLDPKTFESARLDWEFEKEQVLLHDAYRELLEIRRTRGFNREDLRELQVEHGETWLTMRDAAEGSVTFAANFSDAPVTVPVGGELVYSFTTPKVGAEETVLDPWGFAVLA